MNASRVGKFLILSAMLSPFLAHAADAGGEKDGDISAYRIQLKERIELGQQWGELTPAEVTGLQDDLRKVNKLERRTSKHGLSDKEKQSVWKELEKLDGRITSELKDRDKIGWQRNWDRNRDGVDFWKKHNKKFDYSALDDNLRATTIRIADGVKSGRINQDESGYLNDETARLRKILNQAKQDGGMYGEELINYERMVAKLDERLEHSVDNKRTDKWNSGNWHHSFKNSEHPRSQKFSTPPVWVIDKFGGYRDSTEQVKGTIPGNELYRYGGTMKNGRAVPTTPQVNVNSSGHISW
jgi:hypothetical protein